MPMRAAAALAVASEHGGARGVSGRGSEQSLIERVDWQRRGPFGPAPGTQRAPWRRYTMGDERDAGAGRTHPEMRHRTARAVDDR